MELKSFFAQDFEGRPLPFPKIGVYLPGTNVLTAAPLTDGDGNELKNPFYGTVEGLVQFSAPAGAYEVKVSAPGRDYQVAVQFLGIARIIYGTDPPNNDDGSPDLTWYVQIGG